MRLRRAGESDQDGRLERLRANPDPDLGRDCLTFMGPPPPPRDVPAAAAASAAGTAAATGPPLPFATKHLPPPPLQSAQARPSSASTKKATTSSSMTPEHQAQRLRLQQLDREVALARASPFGASGGGGGGGSGSGGSGTGAASRDLDRSAALFLRTCSSAPTASSPLACTKSTTSTTKSTTSPWWALRAREVDGALASRVAALRASLETRDRARVAAAAARVSAACAQARGEHWQRGKQHQAGRAAATASSLPLPLSMPLPPFAGAGMLLPKRPAARPSAAAAPPAVLPLVALQTQRQGPARFTRVQRREVERVAALERVWEAHRHVLVGAAQ